VPEAGLALRVLSYNIGSQRGDVAALAEVVRQLDPDVAVVQEAPRRLRWRTRCADLARRFRLVYGAGGLPGAGNLVLTNHRVRVVESWCVQFPLTPGRHLRGAAFARCVVGGGSFVVAGSHLATDPEERPAQAAVLKRELDRAGGPLVLGCDLNEPPGGASWRMVGGGLLDAAPNGDRTTATFPAGLPRLRLDAIFVDPGISVRSYRVVDIDLARRASDHLPVLAELTLPVADVRWTRPPPSPEDAHPGAQAD
jgi:endonuclease/exonuclease/phosphatase family metal-dependent hydrolase